jgi:hypothetical protein
MEMDVLLGRGEARNHHPGNKEYHLQKAIVQPSYLEANMRKGESAIAKELVDVMQRLHGSRFLENDNDVWRLVVNQRAVIKAKQALRENPTAKTRHPKNKKPSEFGLPRESDLHPTKSNHVVMDHLRKAMGVRSNTVSL